jgi:alkyl hydroperoxide reductase subunit AhpC
MRVARDYGCLIEDKGIALRASYLIDPKGVLRQITMNDLPVGRSVDEALRLVQAFQFTVSLGFLIIFFFFGVMVYLGYWY